MTPFDFLRFPLALAALAAVACGPTPGPAASRYVKSVLVKAAEGATLTVSATESPELGGTSLVIPPGALEQDTTILLELGPGSIILGPDEPAGPVAIWGPSGTRFRQQAQMTLPFALSAKHLVKDLFVQIQEDDGQRQFIQREQLSVDEGGRLLKFSVAGFSQYQPGSGCGSGSCVGSLTLAAGSATPVASAVLAGALGVPMLQFWVSAGPAEAVRVQSVMVQASGTGADAQGVAAVRLYRDSNADGLLDSGDSQLGGFVTYPSDDGTADFGALAELVPAGGAAAFLVVHDFSGAVLGGQTFAASIPAGLAVTGVGSSTGVSIIAGGSAQGQVKTIQTVGALSVSAGPANPGPSNESAGATKLVMLQFRLAASLDEAVRVSELTVQASGTGNDATGVLKVRLYRDLNGNGQLEATDGAPLGAAPGYATFASGTGAATFSGLAQTLPAGGAADYLVTYDLNAAVVMPGQTFAVEIQSGAAVGATGASSQTAIVPTGLAKGALKTVQTSGSLTLAAGPANPAATGGYSSRVLMLQFRLSASSVEAVNVSAVTVRASGSGNDATGVTKVTLIQDVNFNGQHDPGADTVLGDAACQALRFATDNGTATCILPAGTVRVNAGGFADFLVEYELGTLVAPGQTFAASITQGAMISAAGAISQAPIVPSGSASGNLMSIQSSGALTVAIGPSSPPASTVVPSSTLVPMLEFRLSASAVEAVKVLAVTLRASGTGNDATGVAKVKLYRDINGNGQIDVSDVQLGNANCLAGLQYASDNGTVTCTLSPIGEVVTAGGVVSLLVSYDFAATATPGQTFAVGINSGALVSAVGVTSGAAIIPSGSASGSAKTIQ